MDVSLLSCPVCLKPHFQGVDALRSSLISVATSHITCPVCNELFLGLDKLTIHLFSHISNSRVAQDCNSQASELEVDSTVNENCLNKDTLDAAQDIEIIDKNEVNLPSIEEKDVQEKNRIICDICNFHFSDETILDLHQKLLHQTSPDRKTGKYNYHCHLCSKQFKLRGSLMVHLRVAHFGFVQSNHKNTSNHGSKLEIDDIDHQAVKPIANEQITQDLVNNEQQLVNEQKQIFVMPTQNSSTQLEKRKILNMCSKAQDNKQWECEVCLKLFTTKYFLKKHKRLHTGEMPYYCSQCNKYFTFQQSYHKHMLYHSDDKPHICSECGRAFKELSTLHNHERIHSGERPFSCETCGKCFRQRVSYLVHRRIHTGAMPYKCTACNKSFRYKVSQRSHKCPVNPPGCVVRTPDLVEKLIQNQKVSSRSLSDQNSPSAQNSHHIFSISNEDLNTITHNANAQVDHVISVDNTVENFGFLEQNLHVNIQSSSGVNLVENYLPENEILDKTQIELNKNAGATLHENSVDVALETSKPDRQEDVQEFVNFNSSSAENSKDDTSVVFTTSDNGNPDFFALILSPVLSDVQSLCLSNYTNTQSHTKKDGANTSENDDALQTINEESFKELLYGPAPK